MDDKQFNQRMALLKKSYERMESKLEPQHVLQQIEVEDETRESLESINMVRNPSAKWKKSALWITSIASVLLVGILISSYMLPPSAFVQSDEEKIESTYEDWLSSLQKKYQEKREKTRIELNIPEEYFKKLSFVESAEYKYNDKAKNKKIVLNKLAYDPKYLTQLEQEILDSLHTPRELIERIETYENPMSFGQSRYFFSIYYHPMKEVLQYYTNELSQYNKVLSQKKKDYPKELNQLIATAKKQYFELSYDGQDYSFRPNPIFMKDAPVSIDRLHPDVLGYFKYLATGSLFNGENLRFSAEESARILKLYERTLVNDLSNSYLDLQLRNLKKEFENGWLVLLKGIDDKIRYSPEHIKLLNDTANGKYGESMRLTAQFILEEFKREGTSKTIDKLTRQDIGIELSYLSNEVYIEIYDGSTGFQIDTRWIIQTEGLYNAYTSSKDDTILDSLNPMNVVSLFLYAHGKGDQETAKRLLSQEVDLSKMVQFEGMEHFTILYATDDSQTTIKAGVKPESVQLIGQRLTFQLGTETIGKGEKRCIITAISE
ncbi:hypothetical protein AB9L15_02290 [Lysinibacillus fusiformis]|uniref:hypothetical protein n=1 Tax=Lysinibacillus fusiformis TaxID=28031 RepID=UPI0000F37BDA|nr:hypothetical protein [Lysinibacillus fusiformis]EAZ85282.1 hypothetical protein BB14905_11565 [Bacillus sp. B14905]MED4075189.1 hypothetical protein [Lysinibacillus fusiformis]